MVFDTPSPPTNSSSVDRVHSLDDMFESSSSSAIEPPLSDERALSQIESANQQQLSNWKMISKQRQNCTNDMYATTHRSKPSAVNNATSSAENLTSPFISSSEKFHHKLNNDDMNYSTTPTEGLVTIDHSTTDSNNLVLASINPHAQQTNHTLLTIVDEELRNSIWPSSDDHHLSISPCVTEQPLAMFYSDSSITSCSSLSSVSSFDLHSNDTDPHTSYYTDIPETTIAKLLSSSSSDYDSSINSLSDHLFPSTSIITLSIIQQPNPDCNLDEQFLDLHLQKQTSFDQNLSSSSSSLFSSDEPLSPINPSLHCRKCILNNNQFFSDTDDDSQSTTISQNKRPKSLPIAIQQIKTTINDNDTDASSQNSSLCLCSINSSEKTRFRICELNLNTCINGIFSETTSGILNEQTIINEKHSLEHFIMSPTDKVKIQMKYQENDLIKSNELKTSQPEDIDFKRSKLKAIRVLYQNRLQLNSMQSPVLNQKLTVLPLRTTTTTAAGHCDSPLAKRTINPRLLRSVLSCSVIEADDEHEVVSSTTRTGVNGTREKSHIETFNCLRINFTESLLHGKILPCGILDGFTIKLGSSGLFIPKQVVLPVTTFWFNVSEHQAASPYLGFINLQCLPKRGYHTPTKGTITLALLNPNGTAVYLFLIPYDLNDMPPDHRTFIRQRVVLIPENTGDKKKDEHLTRISSKKNLRYLAHIRFVTSQTGKLYMHSDIRLIFARNKLDFDERTGSGKPQLVTITDMPTPKYWSRK